MSTTLYAHYDRDSAEYGRHIAPETVQFTPPTIVGLSGYARSGKDSTAEVLTNLYGHKRFAFADPMREALYALDPWVAYRPTSTVSTHVHLRSLVDALGWDAAKDRCEDVRVLLQTFGTEVGRKMFGENFWVDLTIDKIDAYLEEEPGRRVVITDMRFPNEFAALDTAGATLMRVERPGVGPRNGHESEIALDNHIFDVTIHNDSDLDGLSTEVATAVARLA